MAESIDLTSQGTAGEATQGNRAAEEVPPPAQTPRSVHGRPPIPPGQVVSAPDPARMTEQEKADLRAYGWKEGDSIPAGLQDQAQAAQQAAKQDIARAEQEMPVSEDTPPVQPEYHDINELSPDQQQHYQQGLDEALRQAAPTSEVGQQVAQAEDVGASPGQPERPATRSVPYGAADGEQQAQPGTAQSGQKVEGGSADQAEPSLQTGGETHLRNCPHCGWDLNVREDTEPEEEEKIQFLQSVLSGRPFSRAYDLMGGNLRVTFRTLTTREVDAVYKQVWHEHQNGRIQTDFETVERVNRLRVCLQLLRIERAGQAAPQDLPDGFTPHTNPNAEATWRLPDDSEEPLRLVEDWIFQHILTHESLARMLNVQCHRFNRLTEKLEAVVDQADFWKTTGPPR